MLVVDRCTREVTHSNVEHLDKFLPKDSSVIINNTKVIKARIFGHKPSGGKIESVLIKPLGEYRFLALIRGKVKLGDTVLFDEGLLLEVKALLNDGSREVEFFENGAKLDFVSLIAKLDKIGHIPLPPYIERADEKSDEESYQTRFAKKEGSVAAPTASLHFDDELLGELKASHEFYELTLHVGLGTFKPVDVENLDEHKMHSEYFEIPQSTATMLDSNAKILCIGTTATRTVEFYHRTKQTSGECDIFINPQNPPQRADMLLTNFHLPKSTLIMLVSAFLGLECTLKIYEIAKQNNYRFYSYGDCMLIL